MKERNARGKCTGRMGGPGEEKEGLRKLKPGGGMRGEDKREKR